MENLTILGDYWSSDTQDDYNDYGGNSTSSSGRKKRNSPKQPNSQSSNSPHLHKPSEILDYAINPTFKKEGESLSAQAIQNVRSTYDAMTEKGYNSLFDILWYKQLPCFDVKDTTSAINNQHGMIKYCEWKGQRIPCSAIFQTSPTDRGMCCTFNVEAAEKMFEDKKYKVSSLNILSICYGKIFIRRLHINSFTSTNL